MKTGRKGSVVMETVCILIVVVVILMCTFVKIHQTVN